MTAPATGDVRTVTVGLGDRSYDIIISRDAAARSAELIAWRFPGVRYAIVTDENVVQAQAGLLDGPLGRDAAAIISLAAGEATKSFAQLEPLCDRLLGAGIERDDLVVALGGGVIGDLAGFAASILRRGVRVVQIPTSLLAQVDSSVGGKTGVNTPRGKNLIGTFHQPRLVIAGTDVLATLPDRQLRAGYGEVVKYALLGDAGFFDWLEDNAAALLARDPAALAHAIEVSCRAKAAIVAEDEKESGRRALLNLGHTFGHALEAWAGYSDKLFHGEAIAIGMAQAFRYSQRTGLIGGNTAGAVIAHLERVGLPTRIGDIPGDDSPDIETLMTLMAQDKKVERGQLRFVLVRAIGDAFISRDVEPEALREFLRSELLVS